MVNGRFISMIFLPKKVLYLVILSIIVKKSHGTPGHLVLYEQNDRKYEVSTKNCSSGVYFKETMRFKCICLTGVWGFYENFCQKPIQIVAGDNYCFKLKNDTKVFNQIIIFGSRQFPFQSTLSIFRNQHKLIESVTSFSLKNQQIDPSSSFMSITSDSWTITGIVNQKSASVCLKPNPPKEFKNLRRVVCFWGRKLPIFEIENWLIITDVKKGCARLKSLQKIQSEVCQEIHSNTSQFEGCQNTLDEMSTIYSIGSDSEVKLNEVKIGNENLDSNQGKEKCKNEILAENVTAYWKDSRLRESSESPKNINGELFVNQLRRFFLLQSKNAVLKERLISLKRAETFINLSTRLFKTSCPEEFVPAKFLNVVKQAFLFILNEDFSFGFNQNMFKEDFSRIEKTLESCIKKTKPLKYQIFPKPEIQNQNERDKYDCIKKINGSIKLSDNRTNLIEIPDNEKWNYFEPIIEITWKMFLNIHGLCYEEFSMIRINDHHKFSVFMMQLFTKSIYDNWIKPPDNFELYKLILPYTYFQDIMNNIDYCVGGTKFVVDKFNIWLKRSSKVDQETQDTTTTHKNTRNKRSALMWTRHLNKKRAETQIMDGKANCLQHSEDPSNNLGYERCPFPI